MRRVVVLFILGMICVSAISQTSVSGEVVEKSTGKALPGALVTAKTPSGKAVAFTQSKTDGSFTLAVKTSPDSLSLSVSFLGYKTVTRPLTGTDFRVEMEETTVQIKEVTVKGKRIQGMGDTVRYNVTGFAQKQDHTIGDVLKRMPGIDVDKQGKIHYNGADINKFYIEGQDMLEGKYGVATNGISHTDVGTVEVMENHQPLKVLQNVIYSDQAAINLKLKNKSKGTLMFNGTAGAGYATQPEGGLWLGELFSMYVNGKTQMLLSFKGNNTGKNLAGELADYSDRTKYTGLESYVGILPGRPALSENRTFMNRSYMYTANGLWNLKNGYELKAQADYTDNRQRIDKSTVTTYYLDGNSRVIEDDARATGRDHRLSARVTMEANLSAFYLKNVLKGEINWDNTGLDTEGTYNNRQRVKEREYYVSDNLQIIKRFGKNHFVTINSRNEWQSLPGTLYVTRDTDYSQRIRNRAFYTDESASYSFMLKPFRISLYGGISAYLRKLDTEIEGLDVETLGQEGNAIGTDYINLYVKPEAEYTYRKTQITLSVPLHFLHYRFTGGIEDCTEAIASPTLRMKLQITPRLNVTVNGGITERPAETGDIYNGLILTNYRTLQRGLTGMHTTMSKNVSARMSYRNTRAYGIFANAMLRKAWSDSKVQNSRLIDGDYTVYSYVEQPGRSEQLTAMASASMSMDFMRGYLGVNMMYNSSERTMQSNGRPTDYTIDNLTLGGKVNGNIGTYLNWYYKFDYDCSRMKIMSEQTLDKFIHTLKLGLTPCEKLTIEAGGEYYRNEITSDRYKDFVLLDTKVTYNISKRVELSATLSNVLNHKTYSYTAYSALSSVENRTSIRGREFMVTLYVKK